MAKRGDWVRFIVGGRGNDDLKGSAGRDVILGRNGADVIDGGAGNDILVGDDVHWNWNHCYWGKSRGSHDDYLDGGAGSDLLLAGRGNDVANYALSENLRAHDVYDGGKGFDTLQLTLTHAELQLASVQKDIAAFEAFLARKANPYSDSGRTFHFQSFDLDVRNFEALKIHTVGGNAVPVARNDSYSLNEDTVLLVAGPGVVGNDPDAEGSALSVALVAGPAHGALALNANGSFSYTPAANFSGDDSFTYQVNNGGLDSNVATVALQVAAVNDAPIAADDNVATDEDVPVSGNVIDKDADADGDALSAALLNGPSHGALDFATDGSFTYTPAANFVGADSFTYQISDGKANSGVATVQLAVAPVNDAPVAAEDAVTTAEDTPVSGNVISNDADADGDALSAALLSGPNHGTLDFAANGSFTYTPVANFNGSDSFTYRVNDGKLDSNVVTVALAVAPANDAPVAADDAVTTAEDMPVSGNVVGNDADVDGDPLTAALLGGPSHGALDFAADGSFTYTPLANFNGMDSFTYKVNDGKLDSNVVTVALAVAPANDAPVAADDPLTTAEDMPVSGNVVGNDADVDGDPLTAALLGGPSHGALDFAADGSFTYTPAAGFNGTDSFTYRASDGQASSSVATVTLVVAPVNDAPVAEDDNVPAVEDVPVSGNVIDNDTDADDDGLTAALLGGPSHGALEFAADGTFTYTPAANFAGEDSFTYQVSDGQATSGVATVSLAVAPVNDTPVAHDDVIPEQAIAAGAIRVAVIGGSAGSYVAAAAQLEDSTAFSIDANAISARAFSTKDQWTALIENYDVVVLGDSGFGTDYGAPSLFPALRDYVDEGGGVVTTGWFAFLFQNQSLSGAARADADYITPIGPQTYKYAAKGSTVTIVDSSHPITDGVANYKVNAAVHELAGGIDAGATVLARGVSGSASLPAIVVDEVGQGRTAYFGSLQMASASSYSPDRVAGGTVDQIFERVVAWAAGARDVNAATDEDTPLAIDAVALLANDSDVENGLVIGGVSAMSALGATISFGAGGTILYNPTGALDYLTPGQIVKDSFDYTVLDGSGGTDIATVNLTVAGRADADPLL